MKTKVLFYLLIGCGLFHSITMPAQEILPGYTQARKFAGQTVGQLLFSHTVSPNYFNKGAKFWYEYKTTQGTTWYIVDPEQARKQPLFNLDELAAEISGTTKDPFEARQLPIKNLKLEEDDRTFTFDVATSAKDTFYFAYDYITRKLDTRDKRSPQKILFRFKSRGFGH
jgi:hypothetical protein